MNDFETRNFTPMLFYESEAFDSKDYIYELKMDGIRCLAYLDQDKTVLINKRGKDVTETYPELKTIHLRVKDRAVLDGELVMMINGKPDFFELQRRSLMTDAFKIRLSASKTPVCFVAFDILFVKDESVTHLPLMERKVLLKNNVKENKNILISRYIEEKGIAFFELAKQLGLEGIVAKLKSSPYQMGKRSHYWLKAKVLQEDEAIICGYINKDNGVIVLVLGNFDGQGNLYKVAHVMTSKNKQLIINFAKEHPSPPLFEDSDEVIWIEPMLVGTVQYMMKSKHYGLRQPVFKGLRTDKSPEDLRQ